LDHIDRLTFAGFPHESNRKDAGQYLKVNWNNLNGKACHENYEPVEQIVHVSEYDYDSIMHYSSGQCTLV
jgi:hypothetical protein